VSAPWFPLPGPDGAPLGWAHPGPVPIPQGPPAWALVAFLAGSVPAAILALLGLLALAGLVLGA
jgi:hypothetical protein